MNFLRALQTPQLQSSRRSLLRYATAGLLLAAPSASGADDFSSPPPPPNCVASPFPFSNSTAQAIPNTNVPITSTINVGGAGPYLYDLDLTTFITHSSCGDLDITISHGGTTVTLTTDNGGDLDNLYNGTVWNDDADPDGVPQANFQLDPNQVQVHPYLNNTLASPMTPEEPFAAFLGQNPNGAWTLTINDDNTTAGTIGNLVSWSMNIVTLAAAPTTATPATGQNLTPVSIPAAGTSVHTSTISISAPGTAILDVDAMTNFTHSFSDDLQFAITSPAGTTVGLSNGIWATSVAQLGQDNVYAGTTWDDDADPDGTLPYTTNANMSGDHPYANLTVATPLAPIEALGAFIGENPNGTWTLTFADQFDQDGGTMNAWSLSIATATCALSNFIFADGFASHDVCAWSGSIGDSDLCP